MERVDDRIYAVGEHGIIIYSDDLKENEADRFISLALTKYCSVGSSIRKDTQVKHLFEIIRQITI